METTVEVMIEPGRFVKVTGEVKDIFLVLSAMQGDERTKNLHVRYEDDEVGTTCWQPIGRNDAEQTNRKAA